MTVRHLEWLNLNSQRSYPIKEDTTRTDDTGNFVIPNGLLVDAVVAVDTGDIETLYIKQLTILPDTLTLVLYSQDNTLVGSSIVDRSTHQANDYYVLQGFGEFTTLRGKLVIGEIPDVVGAYSFSQSATELESKVLIPNLRGVSSLGIYSTSPDIPAPLRGHVKLSEGFNIRLTYDYTNNAIRIDAIEGAGLGTSCVCPDDSIPPGNPIKFINGIPPDDSRNFNVQGVGCITVTPIENGIRIENTCEEPCCDCEDVAALQAIADALSARISSLDTRVLTLENC